MDDLLGKVDELSTVNVVSSNPANHDLYEVGVETGALVQLYSGSVRMFPAASTSIVK